MDERNILPPWTPFHFMLTSPEVPVSNKTYNPILMAPPTNYDTIYTTLLRNKEISKAMEHEYTPIFFDMGLLTKVLEITWVRPQELSGVIL